MGVCAAERLGDETCYVLKPLIERDGDMVGAEGTHPRLRIRKTEERTRTVAR